MMVRETTVGPWRVSELGAVVADNETGQDDPSNLSYYGGHLVAESIQWRENANLIAAAPDLLAACKQVLDDILDGSVDMVAENALVAAIKKAEGR